MSGTSPPAPPKSPSHLGAVSCGISRLLGVVWGAPDVESEAGMAEMTGLLDLVVALAIGVALILILRSLSHAVGSGSRRH